MQNSDFKLSFPFKNLSERCQQQIPNQNRIKNSPKFSVEWFKSQNPSKDTREIKSQHSFQFSSKILKKILNSKNRKRKKSWKKLPHSTPFTVPFLITFSQSHGKARDRKYKSEGAHRVSLPKVISGHVNNFPFFPNYMDPSMDFPS